MAAIKLVVYDLDGTLVDSAVAVATILNQMRHERALTPIKKRDLLPWLSMGGEALVANALGIEDKNASKELQEFRVRYSKLPTDISSVYPSVFEVMECLKECGCAVAVCTNKPRLLAEKVLVETGLSAYIDFLNAGGDMPFPKPHPKNLLSCIDKFDLSPDLTVMVGDSTIDQNMARMSGVPFVQFIPGYDDGIVLEKNHHKIYNHINLLDLVKKRFLLGLGSEVRKSQLK